MKQVFSILNPIKDSFERPITQLQLIRALSLGLVVCWALSASTTFAQTDKEQVSTVIRELREGKVTKNPAVIIGALEKARGLDDPKLAEEIIKSCLTGSDYTVERSAGAILMRMKSPKSTKMIFSHLSKNPQYKTRIVLTAVAFQMVRLSDFNNQAAIDGLTGRLYDHEPRVVFTALSWMRTLNNVKLVEAVVKRFKKEQKRPGTRLYNDLNRTLQDLTGEYDIEHPLDWENYWDARKQGLAKPKKKKGNSAKATRRVSKKFFTLSLDSDKLVFIIDISGSMEKKDPPMEKPKEGPKKGSTSVKKREPKPKKVDPSKLPITRQRLFRVKKELKSTIQNLPSNVFFTIISYNHNVVFLDDRAPALVQASSANKTRATQWVDRLKAEGETWTDTAFERLFKEIDNFDTVIFLSDGMPYRAKTLDKEVVRKSIRTINRYQKARIHTIGFLQAGRNLSNFLQLVAKDNDGTFTQLE